MRRRRVRKGTEEIGREEEYDGVLWKGPRARSHRLLTLPLLYHMSSFLVFYQLKEAEEEKGKGSERGEITRMLCFWKRAARNRRDRKQGDGITK